MIIVKQYSGKRVWRRFRVKDPAKIRFWRMMAENTKEQKVLAYTTEVKNA